MIALTRTKSSRTSATEHLEQKRAINAANPTASREWLYHSYYPNFINTSLWRDFFDDRRREQAIDGNVG
jgi:hypothetical protein